MSAIELRGVTKSYAGTTVLSGVDLDVEEGDVLAVVGPSGAGKTTMLRMASGLEAPDSGSVSVLGTPLTFVHERDLEVRRRMAFIMQRPVAFRQTVRDNVAYALRVRGLGDHDDRVDRALEAVGLTDKADQLATRLSGGEVQRMAFARATVFGPSVLLLDEFTANLDPWNVKVLEGAVKGYQDEMGTTVVIVTHNLFQAKRLSRTAAFLMDGRLVEAGPTERLLAEPEDPRTRAFVRGEMVF